MLAHKHGDCAAFAAFEEQHGEAAARNILERFSEELWSRGSEEGVCLQHVECLDTLGDNYEVNGLIEFKKAWYFFEAHSGSAYGTQIDHFELEAEAPEQTPDEDCYDLVGKHTTAWRRACEALSIGSMRSWALLENEHKSLSWSLLSHQPRQVPRLAKPVLGDLALPHEDFHVHALKTAHVFFSRGQEGARALFAHLSNDYLQVLAQAQQEFEALHPELPKMAPISFFAKAMEPVIAARIF